MSRRAWPDVTGAKLMDGRVVVQTHGRTLFLYEPITGEKTEILASKARFDVDSSAVLANALRNLVGAKSGVKFDRGMSAVQVSEVFPRGVVLWLYEVGYRATLWPRYWWKVERVGGGYAYHIAQIIAAEVNAKELLAQRDNREPVELTNFKRPARGEPVSLSELTRGRRDDGTPI